MDGIFSIGRLQLSNSLLNEDNPIGSSRLSKLRQIFEEGKSLQLQFPAEDLGFRYSKGALISEDDKSTCSPQTPSGRRRDYVPSSSPGSRLPHMNIRLFSDNQSKVTLSTLDLISGGNLEFVLIIAPLERSYQLARAALIVAEEFQIPLKVCIMWQEKGTDDKMMTSSEKALDPWNNFMDVTEANSSTTSPSWWEICQMTDEGAILVRPDEHIAWRVMKSEVVNNQFDKLRRVFRTVLGFETCSS